MHYSVLFNLSQIVQYEIYIKSRNNLNSIETHTHSGVNHIINMQPISFESKK